MQWNGCFFFLQSEKKMQMLFAISERPPKYIVEGEQQGAGQCESYTSMIVT